MSVGEGERCSFEIAECSRRIAANVRPRHVAGVAVGVSAVHHVEDGGVVSRVTYAGKFSDDGRRRPTVIGRRVAAGERIVAVAAADHPRVIMHIAMIETESSPVVGDGGVLAIGRAPFD